MKKKSFFPILKAITVITIIIALFCIAIIPSYANNFSIPLTNEEALEVYYNGLNYIKNSTTSLEIKEIVDLYIEKGENWTSSSQYPTVYDMWDEALDEIKKIEGGDVIVDESIINRRKEAKAEIDAMILPTDSNALSQTVKEAKENVDRCTTIKSINEEVEAARIAIDAKRAESLINAKTKDVEYLNKQYKLLKAYRSYSKQNAQKLDSEYEKAINNVNSATTIEGVESACGEGLTAMKNIPTIDKTYTILWIIIIMVLILIIIILIIILIAVIKKSREKKQEKKAKVASVVKEKEIKKEEIIAPVKEEAKKEPEIPVVIPIMESVDAATVDEIMSDEDAERLTTDVFAGREGKMTYINIDTLADNFAAGSLITLDDLKRIGLVDPKFGRIKILARGTLNKVLTIEADSYSLQAVKMITLTGGTAIKLK